MPTDRENKAVARSSASVRLASAVMTHEEAIVEVGLDGTVTRWNPGAERLFGYRAAEMLEQSIARIFPADRIAEHRALLARVARGERIPDFQTTRIKKSGQRIRVSVTFAPICSPEGAVVGMSAHARNSAQQKTAHQLDALLATIVESTDDAVIAQEIDGTILSWNPGAERIFGYPAAEVVGRSITLLYPKERVGEEDLLLTSVARGERVANFDTVRLRKDGTPIDVSITLSPLRDDLGRIAGAAKIVRDITERQRMVAALAEQSERLHVTLHSIADAVISTDARGNVDFMNPVAQRLTGWSQAQALGRPIEQVYHVVRDQLGNSATTPADNPVRRCLGDQRPLTVAGQVRLVDREGNSRSVENSAAPILDALGDTRGVVLVFHDISEQRRLAGASDFLTSHDSLTSLVNRNELEDCLDRVLREIAVGAENAVLYLDLDQFRLVNDACGHAVGDRVLQQLAQLLRLQVGDRDLVARVGGDEFAILLQGQGAEQAKNVAARVCRAIDEFRFVHDERPLRVAASIGIVPVDSRWDSGIAVLHAADAACHAAKEEGKNRVHAWFDLDKTVRKHEREQRLIASLTMALEQNRLQLYAQRIVVGQRSPSTAAPAPDRPAGLQFELLLRLPEGPGKLLPASQFLPVAERCRLAARVDTWMATAVLDWMAENAAAMEQVDTITMNVSGQSIAERSFHRMLIEELSSRALAPEKLCVEISEAAAVANLADTSEFVDLLRARGVRVALDNYGASAAYFGTLKSIAADWLKIDGRFVQNIVRDRFDQAAVRCFCDIAASAGMRTIAEGVETEAAAEMLRSLGVDYLQGYLFHRPEPIDRAMSASLDAKRFVQYGAQSLRAG
jgi:diguanylate cyclase (GGDEF)-like protein/PAS domain S-box-containing protein